MYLNFTFFWVLLLLTHSYNLFIILSCKAGLVYDFKALQCVLEVCAIFIQNTKKFRKCKQIGMIGKFNI
jgi:hypothetical protein